MTVTPPPAAGTPLSGGNATLTRLLARGNNASETEAISFAGQTYAGSTDGLPIGPYVSESVPADAAGRYTFSVPPASAAFLTLAPGWR